MHTIIPLSLLCRADEGLVGRMKSGHCGAIALSALAAVVGGAAVYGFAYGIWRAPVQGVYSMIKMPGMMLALVAVSSLINILLAYVLGSGLSAAQTSTCVLISLAVTSLLLAAVAPVTAFFAFQCPGANEAGAMTSYRVLLTGNTAVVALAGVAGNVRLYQLLRGLTGSPAKAGRVLLSWIWVTGLAGCELSWICSPFLARPDLPIPFLNPNAFRSNFFEYLWRVASGGMT